MSIRYARLSFSSRIHCEQAAIRSSVFWDVHAANGGRTPAWKSAADTAGGRTLACHNAGSRTSNPYDGSRTAAGNRTPAWAVNWFKTPAYGAREIQKY